MGINDSQQPQAKWLGLGSVLGSAAQVDSGGSSGPETLGRRGPELDLEGPCCQPAALGIIPEDEPTYSFHPLKVLGAPGLSRLQESGLRCPEQRGRMASWRSCNVFSPGRQCGVSGWGRQGAGSWQVFSSPWGCCTGLGHVSHFGEWPVLSALHGFMRYPDRGQAPVSA